MAATANKVIAVISSRSVGGASIFDTEESFSPYAEVARRLLSKMKSAVLIRTFQRLMLAIAVLLCLSATASALSGGTALSPGEFTAVGELGACNATLITPELVLTAAHCVCPNPTQGGSNCRHTATMIITDAHGSQYGLSGTVRVHPDYEKFTIHLSNSADLAVIHLDAASRNTASPTMGVTGISIHSD